MENKILRLTTSTALATTLLAFYNLPAQAHAELLVEGTPIAHQGPMSNALSKETPLEDKSQYLELTALDAKPNFDLNLNKTQQKEVAGAKPKEASQTVVESTEVKVAEPIAPPTIQNVVRETQMKTEPVRYEPFIAIKDGVPVVSDTFMENVPDLLNSVNLSYEVVKGNVQLSGESLRKLEAAGYVLVDVFNALEGKYLNFATTAGSILYNAQKNQYIIVWHGTASNAEGWETNFDSELIQASQITVELVKKIKAELFSILSEENAKGTAKLKDLITAVDYVDDSYDFTKMSALKQKLLNDPKVSTNPDLARRVQYSLHKLEMLKSLESNPNRLTYEGKTHRGDTLKVASAFDIICDKMRRHAMTLSPEQRAEARTFITGHSMAGALANIFAAGWAKQYESLFAQRLSADQSRLLVYTLSAAPSGDSVFAAGINTSVGRWNIFDQKCDKDLVPHAWLPEKVIRWLESIPVVGKELAYLLKDMSLYSKDIGFAAIDKFEDVNARAKENFPGKGIVMNAVNYGKDVGSIILDNLNPKKFLDDVIAEYNAMQDANKEDIGKGFFNKAKEAVKKVGRGIIAVGKSALSRYISIRLSPVVPSVSAFVDYLKHRLFAIPHYGIHLHDQQPEGENYGREEHFEIALAMPKNGREGFNAMLKLGMETAGSDFVASQPAPAVTKKTVAEASEKATIEMKQKTMELPQSKIGANGLGVETAIAAPAA